MTASAAEKLHVNDGIYRTTFDPSRQDPCTAVVEALQAATGCESQAVLADSIDPDTLTQLYRGNSESWMLSFDHDGSEITLWGSGRIHVDCGAVESPGARST